MKRGYLGIITVTLLVFCNLVGCTKLASTESNISESEVYDVPLENEVTATSPSVTDTEKNLTEPGIYTLYNEEAEGYLSYDGRNLILSATPSNWWLNKVRKEEFYVYAYDTELVLDIDNAWVKEGTTVKLWDLTGYDVQIWNFIKNHNGTYSIAYSGDNQYCLGLDDGNAVLQIRDEMNAMQEWELVDISDTIQKQYLSFESEGGIIQLQLPLDILSVVSEARLKQWANELETAYYSFYELTDFAPYDYIIVEAYKPSEHTGWVIDNSNIIHIDKEFIYMDLEKMAARDCDWNFCALHEMGHMFDFGRPWNFESEMLTDLKLAYVLEKNGAAAAPSEFKASDNFYGADIINAYDILSLDFSENYNIFGCTKRFLEIKEDIGWEAFKQTFHDLQANEEAYASDSKQQKFENFVEVLSRYGNKEIKSYFSDEEWNTIIAKLNE